MPIIDLQRRLVEVGRLRMGTSKPGKRGGKLPVRLETWRATSRDRERLEAMAELYGGEVKPWEEREGEWDLVTERDQLPVLVIPGQGFSQWWELWSKPVAARDGQAAVASTCVRRCDGVTEQVSGGPCMCPQDYDERKEQAQDFAACKPFTRLSVLLPEVPGLGLWRFESSGYYAAVELQGTVQLLEEATRRGMVFPAVLRIDWRRGIATDGARTSYPVPVVDIAVRAPEVFQIAGSDTAALIQGAVGELPKPTYVPVQDQPEGVTVEAGLKAVTQSSAPTRTARSAAPIGTTVPLPEPPGTPLLSEDVVGVDVTTPLSPGSAVAEEPVEPVTATDPAAPPGSGETPPGAYAVISDDQRKRLWAIVGEYGVPEDHVRRIVIEITGQESTAGITKDVYDAVVSCIQSWKAEEGQTEW